jgi:tetratricopeptide (TPR) repeat protein
MTDVRIMYSEIASTIADKTQVNLSAEEMTRLTSASQVNPESYDNYLKGKPHLDKISPEGFQIALQYFQLALEIDPNNALAHVGVANVWLSRQQMRIVPHQEAMPLIEAVLEKAFKLDNTLAEAHLALAGHRCWGEWDWKGAEIEFQQALRLNPSLADAHRGYSHLLCIMGRIEEALPHIEWALELDPLNSKHHGFYGMVLFYHRRFDDAMAAFRTALGIEPINWVALAGMCWIFYFQGMHDEAFPIYRKLYSYDAELAKVLEEGFEKAGHKGAYLAIADLMVEWYGKPGKSIYAMDISDNYFIAGNYDLAMDWLEKAYEEHDPNLPYLGVPYYDPLRSYPRFQELLRRIGLPVDEKK